MTMGIRIGPVAAVGLSLALGALVADGGRAAPERWPVGSTTSLCAEPPPDSTESLSMDPLHREPMEVTGRAPGARGLLHLAYAPSPFGLAVADDGRPVYRIAVQVEDLRLSAGTVAVAWAATPELDRVIRLGSPDPGGIVTGRVDWARFLVFVTAEPRPVGERWSGPVLLVGRAPSSRMHTMRGHGIFEAHGIGC